MNPQQLFLASTLKGALDAEVLSLKDLFQHINAETLAEHVAPELIWACITEGMAAAGLGFGGEAPKEARKEPAKRPSATPARERRERPSAFPARERWERPSATPPKEQRERPSAMPAKEQRERPSAMPAKEQRERPSAMPAKEQPEKKKEKDKSAPPPLPGLHATAAEQTAPADEEPEEEVSLDQVEESVDFDVTEGEVAELLEQATSGDREGIRLDGDDVIEDLPPLPVDEALIVEEVNWGDDKE